MIGNMGKWGNIIIYMSIFINMFLNKVQGAEHRKSFSEMYGL